jgi:hypothetical protein
MLVCWVHNEVGKQYSVYTYRLLGDNVSIVRGHRGLLGGFHGSGHIEWLGRSNDDRDEKRIIEVVGFRVELFVRVL